MSFSVRAVAGVALAVLVETSAFAAPAPAPNNDPGIVLPIWEHFVAAQSAHAACGLSDKAGDAVFAAAYNDISRRALIALRRLDRGAPDAKIVRQMGDSAGRIGGKVGAEVKANGCASPRIKALLDFYALHAKQAATHV
jgi:hypothetical protein